MMVSCFYVLLIIVLITKGAKLQSTISWLSDTDYTSFKTSFLNLDYNQDGIVTINEAKLGILSMLDSEYLSSLEIDEKGEFEHEVYEQFNTYQPHKYNCVPSINSMDFVDCLIMSVRHGIDTLEDAIIDFDNILNLYFNNCDDISPLIEETCSKLVRESFNICLNDDSIYCHISCFKCNNNKGNMLFNDDIDNDNDNDGNNNNNNNVKSIKMLSRLEKIALIGDHNKRLIERKLTTHYENSDSDDVDYGANKIKIGHVCPFKTKNKHINRNRFVFMSDVHIEPWYNSDGLTYISRFNEYNTENMFQCRNNLDQELDIMHECTLTGYSDPPLSYFVSALHAWNIYARRPRESVLFFGGDFQAHDYLDDDPLAVKILMNEALNSILYYFEPDSIFIMAGNNDGSHNSIFTSTGNNEISEIWSDILIRKDIVNNVQNRIYNINNIKYTTVSLFRKTGYYMKPLRTINSAYFVIITNTNLGSLNPTQQYALEYDLNYVSSINGKVIILGHHPSVLDNMIPSDVIKTKSDNILGIFSGHIHYFLPTNKRGFTILPALTQYSPYSAFAMADLYDFIDEHGINERKIRLTNQNILMYISEDHQLVDSYCWQ